MIVAIAACITGAALTLAPSLAIAAVGLAIEASGLFVAQTCANSFLRDAAPAAAASRPPACISVAITLAER